MSDVKDVKTTTDLQKSNGGAVQAVPPTQSERFTKEVMRQFGSNVTGALEVSEYQEKLIQGYFIAIDRALAVAEENRAAKNKNNGDHKYDNDLPVKWENVNLPDLAVNLVHYARLGLDMRQDNHLFPVPYKNKKTNKYDITLTQGYNGIRYIAEKYAVAPPKAVTIEDVYSTDIFEPIKKGADNKIDSYHFEVTNPFDRGEFVGGFGYIEFDDAAKNKLIIMTRAEIEKRSNVGGFRNANFWGGTVDKWEWEDGKKTKKQVKVEGWYREMCLKTIIREVFGPRHIPIDPQKIDESYQRMKMLEVRAAEIAVEAEIEDNANSVLLEIPAFAPALPPPPQQDAATGGETTVAHVVNIAPAGEPVAVTNDAGANF